MRCIKLVVFLLLISITSYSQDYWQQQVNFTIAVRLDTNSNTLHGFATIVYINHSPDTLTEVIMHLPANALSSNKTAYAKQRIEDGFRGFYFDKGNSRSKIDSLNFKANGENASFSNFSNGEFCKIMLPDMLLPDDSVIITTSFRTKLPELTYRFGYADDKIYAAYWYPRPCVYNDNGWNIYPYLFKGELFNDFGNYKISISVPKKYLVVASGNSEQIPTQEESFLTYNFTHKNIHDFVWVASAKSKLVTNTFVTPSNKKVELEILHGTQNESSWKNILPVISQILLFYYTAIGDYPYEKLTIVEGRSGMEYPGLVVVDGYSGKFRLEQSILHEVGHSWFYAALGTDQQKNMWMDEGITTYYEFRYLSNYYKNLKLLGLNTDAFENHIGEDIKSMFHLNEFTYGDARQISYLLKARRNIDQPITTKASDFTSNNYNFIGYLKAALLIEHLEKYLGTEVFDKAMQAYYKQWKFRHPEPGDLQNVLESVSGKDLNWFFNSLLNTNEKIDIQLNVYGKKNRMGSVSVQSNFNTVLPVLISYVKDSLVLKKSWFYLEKGKRTAVPLVNGADKIIVDLDRTLPDINRLNNSHTLNKRGLTKINIPKVQFLAGLESNVKKQLFVIPLVGYNTTDNVMPGVLLYNSALPEKKFSFRIAPFYSFSNRLVQGSFHANYNWLPEKQASIFSVSINVLSFSGFVKLNTSIHYGFPQKNLRQSPKQEITVSLSKYYVDTKKLSFYEDDYRLTYLQYGLKKKNSITSFSFNAIAETDFNRFVKVGAEIIYKNQYLKNKYVSVRGFAGVMHQWRNTPSVYNFFLSGNYDYRFEDIFIDRASKTGTIAAFTKQTNLREGGFKVFMPAMSQRNILTINSQVDIPGLRFLALFSDVGFSSDFSAQSSAGIVFVPIRDILEIYFPLTGSSYKESLVKSFSQLREQIRFSFHLNKLNPFHLIKEKL